MDQTSVDPSARNRLHANEIKELALRDLGSRQWERKMEPPMYVILAQCNDIVSYDCSEGPV